MGLVKSIRLRMLLMKGEPLDRAIWVLFTSRENRRNYYHYKTGRTAPTSSDPVFTAVVRESSDLVDAKWYARTHGLASSAEADSHFATEGCDRLLAPCPELAADDGRTLTQWGAEYLVRTGVPIGNRGIEPLHSADPTALRPFSIGNPNGKKIAVVSAIFDSFDRLLPVDPAWDSSADFYLFTDRKYEVHGLWQHVRANYHNLDPRRRARFVKTHLPTYFAEYEWVIWLDGNVLLCVDPAELLRHYEIDEVDFATFRHWDRRSLVAEAAACHLHRKEEQRTLLAHLRRVSKHEAFRKPTLFATMVMAMRPSSPAVRRMCGVWWREIMCGSKRDQLSLPLAVHEADGLRWRFFSENSIETTGFFARGKH